MDWVRVKSKMLSAVAYNGEWEQLYLKFRSGDVYCYRGVPLEAYEELLTAKSKGEYAQAHILHRFPYQRVHTALYTAS